jgi:hypothetical protein
VTLSAARDGLRIKIPGLLEFVAQTPRSYIRPVLLDVVQTLAAGRFAINHPPAGWNIGKGWPQAVLFLVVDQDEESAIVVIERIGAQRSPDLPAALGRLDFDGG